MLSSITKKGEIVAKMASHAIFQYNVLAIDDTHNTWTNMIVKMSIPRLLGSSDDKGGEMYPKSKQVMPLARGRNEKCNAKGCMVIGGGT